MDERSNRSGLTLQGDGDLDLRSGPVVTKDQRSSLPEGQSHESLDQVEIKMGIGGSFEFAFPQGLDSC